MAAAAVATSAQPARGLGRRDGLARARRAAPAPSFKTLKSNRQVHRVVQDGARREGAGAGRPALHPAQPAGAAGARGARPRPSKPGAPPAAAPRQACQLPCGPPRSVGCSPPQLPQRSPLVLRAGRLLHAAPDPQDGGHGGGGGPRRPARRAARGQPGHARARAAAAGASLHPHADRRAVQVGRWRLGCVVAGGRVPLPLRHPPVASGHAAAAVLGATHPALPLALLTPSSHPSTPNLARAAPSKSAPGRARRPSRPSGRARCWSCGPAARRRSRPSCAA